MRKQILLLLGFMYCCASSDAFADIRPDAPEGARAVIQRAIDGLPEEGGSVFIPAGRYVLDGMIHINRSNVMLHGEPGTLLILEKGVQQPNILIGSDSKRPTEEERIRDVVVSGIELDGNKDEQKSEFHPAKPWLRNNTIDIRKVDDLLIEKVNAHHARSGGIVASWGCNRISIRGSAFHHNFFDGIALYSSRHLLISDFYCYSNNAAGLSLDNRLKDVTFSNGHIYENKNVGIFARDADGLNFRNLVIRENGSFGAFLAHTVYPIGHKKAGEIMPHSGIMNSHFTNCSFVSNQKHALWISSVPELSSGNSVISCTFKGNFTPSIRTDSNIVLRVEDNIIFDERTANSFRLSSGETIKALPRQLRIDLIWEATGMPFYEVQRSNSSDGPWEILKNPTPEFHLYSDYIGDAGKQYYYRVLPYDGEGNKGEWSSIVGAESLPFDENTFLDDLQEACVRFYFELANSDSGLTREGAPGWVEEETGKHIYAIGATGMGMANIIVGVDRGFVSRDDGVILALKMLQFLAHKSEKFHGAYPHWLRGDTGKIIPFDKDDFGVDLVETAFIIQGCILLREYFDKNTAEEREIRSLSDSIVKGVQWDKFASVTRGGDPALMWHWTNEKGFSRVPIRGFHEALMPYLLAIGADTHSIDSSYYYTGWMHPEKGLGEERERFDIPMSLCWDVGFPLFFIHYSNIGFDPRALEYRGKSYFEHYINACKGQVAYARSRKNEFKGYEKLWGLTASMGPDGYKAYHPGDSDDGTIATTAALSSIPYLPDEVIPMMRTLYLEYGSEIWGPFGFYNAFNPTRDWVSNNYIGIELGPIAPMIENYRSGLFWKLFMKSAEAKRAVKRIFKLENKI